MPETKALSFEELCNFVAISETHKHDEVLAQLILQLIANNLGAPLLKSSDVADNIRSKYELTIDATRIQSSLDRLVSLTKISYNKIDGYKTESRVVDEFSTKLEGARDLENEVKTEFLHHLQVSDPKLDPDQCWTFLQQYLWKAFRRHGLATISLLSRPVGATSESLQPLSNVLNEVLAKSGASKSSYEKSIRAFFQDVATYPRRTRYITQLADSTFSYCSLIAPPEVSAHLRIQLSPLMLFFDTNFIFGLLGLHEHPFVEVSTQLVDVIRVNKFPYKLRYRESTLREFTRSLNAASKILLRQHWPQNISKVVSTNDYLVGIELKYHQSNSERPIDASVFLAPFTHVADILKMQDFAVYKDNSTDLVPRATMQSDYEEFLKRLHKEKPIDAIQHDAELLEGVRRLRSNSSYSLDSGALLVTCDIALQRFDYSDSWSKQLLPSVVLPNQFYQLLRPFVPASDDFDKSFALTFAIPEFRLIDSSSQHARSRMVALMSSFGDIPEETATKILANKLLTDQLRDTARDEDAKELINAAIVDENARLLRIHQQVLEKGEREEKLRIEVEQSYQKDKLELEGAKAENERQAALLRRAI